MKVKATKAGFFGGSRRRVGDVFDVPDGTKAAWFVDLEKAPVSVNQGGKGSGQKPVSLSEMAKKAAVGPLDSIV